MPPTPDQAAAFLSQLYTDLFGRLPDPAAAAVLIPALEAGTDPAAIRAQLATGSPEATNFIAASYQGVLGRAPDSAGLVALVNAVAAGALTQASARAALASTQEASNAVGSLYRQVLGRAADPQGLAGATAALQAGQSLGTLRQQLAASPEAAATVGALYQQALGRVADPAGLAQVTAGLGTTLSVVDVRAGLVGSPEAKANLTASFERSFGRVPPAATVTLLLSELAAGRPFSDTVQVTVVSNRVHDATFSNKFGYLVPAQYSSSGADMFALQYDSVYDNASQNGFTSIPVAVSGSLAGPDKIVLDLQVIGANPMSYVTATVDGVGVGAATISAHPATQPFVAQSDNQVTFTGAFGSAPHDVRLVVADPVGGAVVLQDVATFNGIPFLLGRALTDAGGVVDVFTHGP